MDGWVEQINEFMAMEKLRMEWTKPTNDGKGENEYEDLLGD